MITGLHAILYSKRADELRAFLSEALKLPSVDAGGGWPIFAAPPTEIAVHPRERDPEHEIYLICDDIESTLTQLEVHGVMTEGAPVDRGWGIAATLLLPGGERLGIYEPRHPSPVNRA